MKIRWMEVLAVLGLAACAEQVTEPEVANALPNRTTLASVGASVAVMEIVDLDVGAALGLPFDANVQAVNDSGWVFIGDDMRRRGLVWFPDASGAYLPENLKVLPTELRWLGLGTNTDAFNGRGDYLPYYLSWETADRVVLSDGERGWKLAEQPLPPPAGFEGPVYAWGINDSRLIVGHGTNPSRVRKGYGSDPFPWNSPIAWTVNALGQTTSATALPIPAASAGCQAGHVRATAVNDNGVIVGYAQMFDAKSGNYCAQQAVLWRAAGSAPIQLPRTTTIPGFPAKPRSNELHFSALHINNAGVVAGRVGYKGDTRVVRWRPVGSGYGPPEFNSFWSFPAALDECGRMAVDAFGTPSYAGVWGANPGDVPVRLPVPEGFTIPSGAIWDLVSHPSAGDLVVGEGWSSSTGDHVLLWKLGACGQ